MLARTLPRRAAALLGRLVARNATIRRRLGFLNRIGLRNRDFTIIADNCWGGLVYQSFGLPYRSPFVNLFLFPECYLALLRDFERMMRSDLAFIDVTASRYTARMPDKPTPGAYPVGVLGDGVELHFLHYRSEEHARAKWLERRQRINRRNILFKFGDRLVEDPALIAAFDALPYRHKVCLTRAPHPYRSVYAGGTLDVKRYLNAMHDAAAAGGAVG